LDFGHRLSPGHGFGIETSYPAKIAVSIIYARLPATNMEKNLIYLLNIAFLSFANNIFNFRNDALAISASFIKTTKTMFSQ